MLVFLCLCGLADALSLHGQLRATNQTLDNDVPASFADFVQQYGRSYKVGSQEYKLRQQAFSDNLVLIENLNREGGDDHAMFGVTELCDYTPHEVQSMLNYKPFQVKGEAHLDMHQTQATVTSEFQRSIAEAKALFHSNQSSDSIDEQWIWTYILKDTDKEVDWNMPVGHSRKLGPRDGVREGKKLLEDLKTSYENLKMSHKEAETLDVQLTKIKKKKKKEKGELQKKISTARECIKDRTLTLQAKAKQYAKTQRKGQRWTVLNQQHCGSCWAFSATANLLATSYLYDYPALYSVQQFVEWIPNPRRCGGTGGCHGDVSESAFKFARDHLAIADEDYKYKGDGSDMPTMEIGILDKPRGTGGVIGVQTIPSDSALDMRKALYYFGPVSASFAATPAFSVYGKQDVGGIMQRKHCETADGFMVVNHAVLMVGYGHDTDLISKSIKRYWFLQNSYGDNWGIDGYFKVYRGVDEEESHYCKWDNKPLDGFTCARNEKGEDVNPDDIRVCGSCGVLTRPSRPVFRLSKYGYLARKRLKKY